MLFCNVSYAFSMCVLDFQLSFVIFFISIWKYVTTLKGVQATEHGIEVMKYP